MIKVGDHVVIKNAPPAIARVDRITSTGDAWVVFSNGHYDILPLSKLEKVKDRTPTDIGYWGDTPIIPRRFDDD